MAFKLLLLISLTIALVSSEEQPPGKRLIKYKLGEPAKWMTPGEMGQHLSEKSFGFLDLTREGVDNTEGKTGEARSFNEETSPQQNYTEKPLQKDVVEKLFSSLKKDRMEASVRKLSSYHSRHTRIYFGPKEAEGWLNEEIESILTGYKGSSSVRQISDPYRNDPKGYSYRQNNIIVKLEGQDPELVILGAHYDTTIGNGYDDFLTSQSKRAPGADDNASGCAVLLEVMRILVQPGTKLKQSVEFHFYAAKELGTVGSFDVAKKYKDEKAKVKGMLNLDRCGNGRSIGFVLGNSKWPETNRALTDFVNMLVKEYVQEDILSREMNCDDNCFSDHIRWTDQGFPSAYVVEEVMTPHIHMKTDTVETVNFELVNDFAKVALAFVVELAEVSVTVSSGGGGRPQDGWTLVGINLMVWIWIRL